MYASLAFEKIASLLSGYQKKDEFQSGSKKANKYPLLRLFIVYHNKKTGMSHQIELQKVLQKGIHRNFDNAKLGLWDLVG